jgi:disulfide bond formation protein DsbB
MRRELNVLGLAVCLGLLGYAWYAQAVLGLEPCPLCIFQRVGVAAMGVLFLLAALHHPRRWGAYLYGILVALAALITMGVATRQVWIMHLPPGSVPACGASLAYMLQIFNVADVIRKVLTGSGECAKVTWMFLGLSMPAWVLLAAAALGALGLVANRPAVGDTASDRATPVAPGVS